MTEDPFKTAGWRAYAKHAEEEMIPMLKDSAVSMVMSSSGELDMKQALELGAMILLDKPIITVVTPGTEISEKLRLVSDHVIEVDLSNEVSRNKLSLTIAGIVDRIKSGDDLKPLVDEDDEQDDRYCHGQFPNGCGALAVEHKQKLNKVLIKGLVKVAEISLRGPVHLKDAIPDYSQRCNFQKMRWFDLVEKSHDMEGKRLSGHWNITRKGRLFLGGIGYCYPIAWTWRGRTVRFEGEPIEITDVVHDVRLREDWAADARTHREES